MNNLFIEKLNMNFGASLAPMAGLTDKSMRILCDNYGATSTVSEMISAKALTMGDKKSVKLMKGTEGNGLYGIQIFGEDYECMGKATDMICSGKYGIKFDFIDINMGCPAPKITSSGAGSALMKTPDTAAKIAEEVVENAQKYNVPVTVKMRLGWDGDKQDYTACDIAQKCESVGIQVLTVHGRTRAEMYRPGIHEDAIAQVKQCVKIPVIANGDVTDIDSYLAILKKTCCDGVAIGRGAMGNPWLFSQISAAASGKSIPAMPTIAQKLAVMKEHIYAMCMDKGEFVAMQQARSIAGHYMHGLKGAASLRRACCALKSFTDLDEIINTAFEHANKKDVTDNL